MILQEIPGPFFTRIPAQISWKSNNPKTLFPETKNHMKNGREITPVKHRHFPRDSAGNSWTFFHSQPCPDFREIEQSQDNLKTMHVHLRFFIFRSCVGR